MIGKLSARDRVDTKIAVEGEIVTSLARLRTYRDSIRRSNTYL